MSELLVDYAQAIQELPDGVFKAMLVGGPQSPQVLENAVRAGWPIWMPSTPFDGVAGLRMMPGSSARSWPIAVGTRLNAAQTLGTDLATSPTTAYTVFVLEAYSTIRQIDRMLDVEWPAADAAAVTTLQAAAGGAPSQVQRMRDLLLAADRSALQSHPDDFILGALHQIDPSPEQLMHQRCTQQLMASEDCDARLAVHEQSLGRLGTWENHIAFAASQELWTRREQRQLAPIAWHLLHLPPQFDGGGSVKPVGDSTGILTADILRRAIVAVSKVESPPPEWMTDPWALIVMPAVIADPNGAWHLSYMEAAAEYDARDEPEMAWTMLCAGAFWVSERGGPWRPFFDAARALAERRGWADCAWALNDMADRAELDRKPQTAVPGDGEDSP